jgi:hypothetical protein
VSSKPLSGSRLAFGEDYPKDRTNRYLFQMLDLLLVPVVARALGKSGLNLVRVIVSMENQMFFRQAVLITDDDLRPRVDCSEKTLVEARRRCIAAGWIHYEPATMGQSSRIWTKVPQWVDVKFSDGTRWRNSTETSTSNSPEKFTETSTSNSPSLSSATSSKFILSDVTEEWTEVEKLLKTAGVETIVETVAACCRNGLKSVEAVELIDWWQKHSSGFDSPSGALVTGLKNFRPGVAGSRFPRDLAGCFPKLREGYLDALAATRRTAADAAAAATRAREESNLVERKREEKQLLLAWESQFGEVLNEMEDSELASVIEHGWLLEHAKKLGRNSDLVRPLLLAELARFFGGSSETVVSMKS